MENSEIKPSGRFASAPRNDPSHPRRVRCLNPFRWLEVNEGGVVTPCCGSWFKGSIGSLREETLEEIWNGEQFRNVREAMYEGGDWQSFCNARTCPQVYNDTWVAVDFITPETYDIVPITQGMLDDIREGRTLMSSGPAQVGLSCDPRCNLHCIMCSAPAVKDRSGVLMRKALEGVEKFLPSLRRIKLMGDGEVFVVPEAREFLFHFDAERYPDVAFLIHTNGLLLTPEMWEKIRHIRVDWLVVSVDAATKETYERIRVGGNWEILMRNLEFLAERYREERIRLFHLSMTVMKSNHHEMVAFAELGKRLGVTCTYFFPIIGDYGEEQIFDRRDARALRRVAKQLRHPAMDDPAIDTNALSPWRDWRPGFSDYKKMVRRTLVRLGLPFPHH